MNQPPSASAAPTNAVSPVNVFANDPNAKGLSLEQVTPPTGASPFSIPGWTGAGGLYNPGTPQFEAGALYVVLTRTFAAWVDFFGASFGWQPGFAQLPIVPRAGQDFNAYYDRQGLKFFYNTDSKTGQTVYSCESSDIVAHECGHAVLDAHHPEYWDSLLGETAAFHEAFGDMSAALVTLGDAAVRQAILAENGGDLAVSNAVSRLAEQLARGIYDSGHEDSVVSADALRDLVNAFQYSDPDKLPARTPASQLSSESHSFSRVFSGSFYDVLVGIYTQLRGENAALTPDAALVQARSDAGHLLAQGLLLSPKGDAAFKTVAAAMFKADTQNFADKYFAVLRQAFVQRGILSASEADALKPGAGVGHTRTSASLGTATVEVGAPLPLGSASVQVGTEVPSQVRSLFNLPAKPFRLVEEKTRRGGHRVLQYAATRDVTLQGKNLGPVQGAMVTLWDSLAVDLDSSGRITSSHLHEADSRHERRVQDHVAKLVARDRIYTPHPGETVDPADLIARKQPYYITYDAAGHKRVRRAFIACDS